MRNLSTAAPVPQPQPAAAAYPVVSHRLVLMHGARRDARRRHVNPVAVIQAVEDAYRRTRGNRFEARRAGWQATDALLRAGQGV